MTINIGHFTDVYLPEKDGISTTVRNYAYWLNKKYGKSYVITPNTFEYANSDPFEVIQYNNYDLQLKNKINNINLDLIHVHTPFNTGKIGLKIAKEKNIPIIASCHMDYYNYFVNNKTLNILVKCKLKKIVSFYNHIDVVYTYDKSIMASLISYGFKRDFKIIEHGSDFFYDPNNVSKDIDYINHLYNIDADTNVLLYVGKLNWENNLRLIIDSLINLKKLRQRFKLIFIGDGKARNDMIKLVEENKLKNNVIFVGEIHEREQLVKYYVRANLLLFPTTLISSGLVIREAASVRCPTLVIKEGLDTIKDNYNGYLSENNSLSYAQRIISALNDRNKEGVGITAQQTLTKSYEKIVEEIYEEYIEKLNSSKQY